MMSKNLTAALANIIAASHILHYQGVFDAYGHVSVRNPDNSSTFWMSRNLAPALVSGPADMVEYLVSDASPIDPNAPAGFIERTIHSSVYKQYSGVKFVVHAHAADVVPFTVTDVPFKPVHPTASFLGLYISQWIPLLNQQTC